VRILNPHSLYETQGGRTGASDRISLAKIIGCVGIGSQSEGSTISDGYVDGIVLIIVEVNVGSPL
jgi:hypothetical protein